MSKPFLDIQNQFKNRDTFYFTEPVNDIENREQEQRIDIVTGLL